MPQMPRSMVLRTFKLVSWHPWYSTILVQWIDIIKKYNDSFFSWLEVLLRFLVRQSIINFRPAIWLPLVSKTRLQRNAVRFPIMPLRATKAWFLKLRNRNMKYYPRRSYSIKSLPLVFSQKLNQFTNPFKNVVIMLRVYSFRYFHYSHPRLRSGYPRQY